MSSPSVFFDESLPVFVNAVSTEFGADALGAGLVMRDTSGRLRFVSTELSPDNEARVRREVRLAGVLGAYARQDRILAFRDDPGAQQLLEPLRRHFVPIEENEQRVTERIVEQATSRGLLAPIGVFIERSPGSLLQTMTSIGVMEKRANGKINVPDIFRVEASILRKGGVAVPRRN